MQNTRARAVIPQRSVGPEELSRQATLQRYQIPDTTAGSALDSLVRSVAELCEAPIAVVSFVTADRQWFKAKTGLTIDGTSREHAFCARTVETRSLFVVEDATSDDAFRDSPLVAGKEAIRFYAGVPILTSDGHAIGALAVMDRKPRRRGGSVEKVLEMVAPQVTLELDLIQARDALGRSEDRLRVIVETLNTPLIVTRISDDEVLFANSAFEALVGGPPLGVDGSATSELFVDPSSWRGLIDDLEESGEISDRHLSLRRVDGATRKISLSGRRMDHRGEPVFVATLLDTTQLEEAQGRLTLLGAAIEQSDDLVLITDRHGLIEYVNTSWCETIGYCQDEVIGKTPSILRSGGHDASFYKDMWDTILGGDVWRGRITNRTRGGSIIHEDKTITPIKDAAGAITHFLATAKDVTEEVNLEKQLRQAQKLEALGRLAGGVAHDFNNLLTVILGHLALAQDEAPVSSGHFEEARQAALKAADLTSQLLAFSCQREPDSNILDVNEVIEDVTRMLDRVIGEDIQMKVSLEPIPLWVSANGGHLGQILMNLAVNARDAMTHGGALTFESTRVTIDEPLARKHHVEPGRYAMIAVTDDGSGMSDEVRAMAFEPFFSTKEAELGTGLGLATVYGIITQSSGAVWIDSQPGLGTTVTFLLPLSSEPDSSESEHDWEEAEWLDGSGRILVVEDEPAVRSLVVVVLERAGFDVLVADSGESALELCRVRKDAPDLLITDIMLPGLSGLDLSEEFSRAYPATRQLHMSGYAPSQQALDKPHAAVTTQLNKPFTPNRLLAAVQQALRHRGDDLNGR